MSTESSEFPKTQAGQGHGAEVTAVGNLSLVLVTLLYVLLTNRLAKAANRTATSAHTQAKAAVEQVEVSREQLDLMRQDIEAALAAARVSRDLTMEALQEAVKSRLSELTPAVIITAFATVERRAGAPSARYQLASLKRTNTYFE